MKISKTILLEGKKHFLSFNPDKHFPPILHFKISPMILDLNEEAVFNGFLDIIYCMPDGNRIRRRQFITKKDLSNTFDIQILAGDMVEHMLMALYYELPEGSLLGVELNTSFYYPGPVLSIKDENDPLCYLEWLRSLTPGDFESEVLWALGALETYSPKGSRQTFKKWALTDQTIRLATSNQIPNVFLDWVAQTFFNEYNEIQQTLKINKI